MIPFVLVSTSHLPVFSTKFAASNFCLDEEFADAYVAWTAQAADHSGTLGSQKLDSISGNWCRFSACSTLSGAKESGSDSDSFDAACLQKNICTS